MRKLIPALVLAALAATACGGGTDAEDASSAPAAAPSMSDKPMTDKPMTDKPMTDKPMTDKPMSDKPMADTPALWKFQATSLDGKPFDGSSLTGKPVVLWFWAPWCPTCRGEGPAVSAAAKKYDGKVEFVGVAGLDKSKEQMEEFVSRTGTSNFTHLDDRTGSLYKHFKVTTQSSYLLVDPEGGTESAVGPLSESDLSELIDDFAL